MTRMFFQYRASYLPILLTAFGLVGCGNEANYAAETATESDPLAAAIRVAKNDATFARFVDREHSSLKQEGDRRISRGRLVTDIGARANAEHRFSLGAGPTYRVTLRLEDAAPVDATKDAALAIFEGALPSTDLVASATDGAAELLLVLRDPSAPNRFSFAVETGTEYREPTFDSAGNLVFIPRNSGAHELIVPPPSALDGNGVRHRANFRYEPSIGGYPGHLIFTLDHRDLPHPVLLDPAMTIWRFRQVEQAKERWGHASAYDARRRRIVTVGGGSNASSYYTDTLEWDGSTMESFTGRTLVNDGGTLGRGAFGMLADRRLGRTILFGGFREGAHYDDLWQYDGNAWTSIPTTGVRPDKRGLCGFGYDDSDGSYLLFGGADLSKIDKDNPLSALAAIKTDTWRFADGVWTQKATGATNGYFGASLAYDVANKHMLSFAGAKLDLASGGIVSTSDLSLWTGTAWKPITTTGDKPTKRAFSAFVWDTDQNRLLMAGGADGVGALFGASSETANFYADSYSLSDPEGDGTYVWKRLADFSPPRAAPGAAYDSARKQLVLYGGLTGVQQYADEITVFDGTRWTTVSSAQPAPRTDAAFAWDATTNALILFGGENGATNTTFGDTWSWDGRSWTQLAIGGPSARRMVAATSIKDGMLIFGGRTTGAFSVPETWIFRNNQWKQSTVGATPDTANATALAYDTSRNVVVRFGGDDGSGRSTDATWEFSEATGWKKIATVAAPPAETGGALFYDPRIGIVSFGGQRLTGYETSESWLYEPQAAGGPKWSKLATGDVPSRRQTAPLAFDEARAATVMVGGRGDAATDDFYVFDGKSWANLDGAVPLRPSKRSGNMVAYDRARQQTITFSGSVSLSGDPISDTWILQASGYGCTSDADCGSLFCTDGVCCGSRECGTCETCAGAVPGSCSVVPANQPDGRTCVGDKACDGARACKGGLGGTCKLDADCAGGVCVDGICCDNRCQDGCRTCDATKMAKPGKNGVCSDAKNWVCKKTCSNAQDCIAPDLCNENGQCVAPPSAAEEAGCVVTPEPIGPGFAVFGGAFGLLLGSIVRRRAVARATRRRAGANAQR